MSLPSLKVAIPVIFGIWCLVGVAKHGTVMLAYPAMWLVVALLLAGLHFSLKPNAKAQADNSTEPPTSSHSPSTDSTTADKHVSAAV